VTVPLYFQQEPEMKLQVKPHVNSTVLFLPHSLPRYAASFADFVAVFSVGLGLSALTVSASETASAKTAQSIY
jgi:hypothetical protein